MPSYGRVLVQARAQKGSRTGHHMENVFNLPQGLPQFVKQEQSDPQETATLLEIGQTLADVPHLRRAMARALELLCHARGFSRGFVLLLDSETDEMRVEACFGLNEEAARRVTYRVGEGVAGRVAESGKPVVVPQASREPLLLQRLAGRARGAAARHELSFVCVPLMVSRRPVGVLGAYYPYAEGRDYERATRLLSIVASMVAQALRVERYIEAERARLLDENTHLKQELRDRYDFSHIVGSSNAMRQVYE